MARRREAEQMKQLISRLHHGPTSSPFTTSNDVRTLIKSSLAA